MVTDEHLIQTPTAGEINRYTSSSFFFVQWIVFKHFEITHEPRVLLRPSAIIAARENHELTPLRAQYAYRFAAYTGVVVVRPELSMLASWSAYSRSANMNRA